MSYDLFRDRNASYKAPETFRVDTQTNTADLGNPAQKAFAIQFNKDINEVIGMDQKIVDDAFAKNQGMTGMEMGKIGLAAGQLGLGVLGYREDRKIAKAQVGLLREQLDNAKNERKARTDVRSGLAAAFG